MAYRQRRFQYKKRRAVKRKAPDSISTYRPLERGISIRNNVYGFPKSLRTRLRYNESVNLTSTVGALAKYIFSMNGCYDPNTTGTGHQPLYFDQFSAVYNHYTVISSKATLIFTATNTDQNDELITIGTTLDDDATTATDINTLCEMNTSKHSTISQLTGGFNQRYFVCSFDCKKDLNINPFDAASVAGAAYTANPSEETKLCLFGQSYAASTITVQVDVTIVYDVIFTEQHTPTQS